MARKRGNPTGRAGRDWRRDPTEVKEFVKYMESEGFAPLTIRRYRMNLMDFFRHIAEKKGKLDVSKIGWKDVQEYKGYLVREGLINKTVDGYMQAVRAFYRFKAETTMATKWVNLEQKVKIASKVRDKKKGSRRWKSLPWKTVQEVMARKDELRSEDYVFFMLGLYTGGRAQFYGLRWDDIDLEAGVISKTIKRGKPWEIPLHPELRPVLERHLATRELDSGFIFGHGADPNRRKKTLDKIHAYEKNGRWAYHTYRRIQETLGLKEKLHPHRIRKSFATFAKRMGLDPQYTQQILGHDDIAMTLDVYTEVDQRDLRQKYEGLSFDPGNGGDVEGNGSMNTENLVEVFKSLPKEDKAKIIAALLEA